MRMLVVKTNYAVVKNTLYYFIYGRGEDGSRVEKVVVGTRPYFYAEKLPTDDMNLITYTKQHAGISLEGKHLIQIFTRFPYDVPKVRAQFQNTYEANIPYEERIRYDLGIRSGIEFPDGDGPLNVYDIKPWDASAVVPRIAFFDIETDDRGEFVNPANPTAEVVSFSYYDNYTDSFIVCINCRDDMARMRREISAERIAAWYAAKCNEHRKFTVIYAVNERNLFEYFRALLNKLRPDVISGFYADGFDIPLMANKARNRKYPFVNFNYGRTEFVEYEILDVLKAYKKYKNRKLRSYKLEHIAQTELGFGKIQRRQIHWMYDNEPERLARYNIQDVRLLDLLNRKLGLFRYFFGISCLAGCPLRSTVYNSLVVDSYILHELNGRFALPTEARTYNEVHDDEWRGGGKVHDAGQTRYRNVISIDNSHEYPAVMMSFNIDPSRRIAKDVYDADPEKYRGRVFVTPRGNYYLKEPRGVLPQILAGLLDKEDALKRRKKELIAEGKYGTEEFDIVEETYASAKALRNSVYGVVGANDTEKFRLRDENAFSDVTSIARMHEQWNIDLVEREFGAHVIYGDTDSVKFTLPGEMSLEEIVATAQAIVKRLNESYAEMLAPFGITTHHLHVAFECVYDTYFQWGSKKHYATTLAYRDGKYFTDLPVEDRIEIKGAKNIRSDSSEYTKGVMDKVLHMILSYEPESDIRDYVRAEIGRFDARSIPVETLHRPIGLKARLAEYKERPVQLRAMEFANAYLGKNLRGGDKLYYMFGEAVVMKDNKCVVSDVWAIEKGDKLSVLSDKYDVVFKPDWKRLKQDNLEKPLVGDGKKTRGPLLGLGMNWDYITTGARQMKLEI